MTEERGPDTRTALQALIATWRDQAAPHLDASYDAERSYAITVMACADELEIALDSSSQSVTEVR